MERLSVATINITPNINYDNLTHDVQPLLSTGQNAPALLTQLSNMSNTSNESGIAAASGHNVEISGDFSEEMAQRIVNEINNYIREEKETKSVRTTCMSTITWLLSGNTKKNLEDRMNYDMFADLARSNYFIGETKISVAGDENASFELFKKEIEKDEFKWVEQNIESISKFFHQGLVQIVLGQLLKVREDMTANQLFKENVNEFDKGLNNVTLDRNNQDITYCFYENHSIELRVAARVKHAGYAPEKDEEGDSKLIISDKEKIISSTESRTVPKSQLYIRISFMLENGEFSIHKEAVNQYAFFLAAKKIMNV